MLTPRQREALDLSAHTAVIANAGSGKTKVLVERYLAILLANPDYHPKDLVAITFTEQAARDLKRKILLEIDERLGSDQTQESNRRRLEEIRMLLGSAQISTIHAFCNQLLRTYPVEANVDASFGILMPPEDGILLDESIRSVFYRLLQKAYDDEGGNERKFLDLFRSLGRNALSSAIRSMVGKRAIAQRVVKIIRKSSDEAIVKRWQKTLESYLQTFFLGNIDIRWYERCISYLTNGKQAAKARDAFQQYTKAREFPARLAAALGLLQAFHTLEYNKLSKSIIKDEYHQELEREILPALPFLRRYRSLAEAYLEPQDPAFNAQYASLMRTVVELYEHVMSEYEETKISLGVLDHDDSLQKALELTERSEIARELASRYRFILVDEYQDTDPVQYSILERITKRLSAATNLMVVGDPKQSIYGFRNAELQLFFSTLDAVRQAPNHSVVELQENFRILTKPLALINTLFTYIFQELPSATPQSYLPLVKGRPSTEAGSVEIIIAHAGKDRLPGDDEAALIAKKIRHITHDVSIDGHAAQYSDIAILLRTRTRQREIEHALHAARIPFSIYGGTGFYLRQEIVDITAYLQFLLDPADDVALTGILRSPFFGFNDADLIKIARVRRPADQSFWDAFVYAAAYLEAPPHWHRALAQIKENLVLTGRLAAYQLIDKIFEETNIYGIYSALDGGKQAIANLEKFASMALTNESAAFFGTYDFVERIALLAERDEQEAQAEIRAGENTVRIMTIHAAKGLEFPIVFLPQLEREVAKKDSRATEVLLDPRLGALLPIQDAPSQHWAYKFAQQEKFQRELDEEKRIFYVAATRARDHLVLSATISEDKSFSSNSCLHWLERALDVEFADESLEAINLHPTIEVYSDELRTKEAIDVNIPILRTIAPPKQSTQKEAPTEAATLEVDLDPVEPSLSQSRYSPTQLLHYIECPTKYYLRYVLGLPEEQHLSFDFEPADLSEQVKGTLLGQLVHAVLANIDSVLAGNGAIHEERFDLLLKQSLEHLELYDDKVFGLYRDQVLTHVRQFLTSDFAANLKSQDAFTELPLRTMLNERQMLSGVIDRLYKDPHGHWEILDYKTDQPPITKQKLDRYHYQMRFYAYLVSRMADGGQDNLNAHLFFTQSGVAHTFSFSQSDLFTVGADLNETVSLIRHDQEAKSLAAIKRNRDHCSECPYYRQQESRCIAEVS